MSNIATSDDKSDLISDAVPNVPDLLIYRYPIRSALFVLLITIATYFSILPIEGWERNWFLTILIYGILAVMLPLIAGFIFQKSRSTIPIILEALDLPEDQAMKWLSRRFTFVFGNRSAYIVGIVLSVAAVWTIGVLGHPWTGMARILVLASFAILFALVGMVGWGYLGLLLLINSLKNKPVKGEPFNWPEKSFRKLNNAYLQMFMAGSFIYLANAIGVWVSPG